MGELNLWKSTPLHFAWRKSETTKTLMDIHYANNRRTIVERPDYLGYTMLHYLAYRGKPEDMKYLLKAIK